MSPWRSWIWEHLFSCALRVVATAGRRITVRIVEDELARGRSRLCVGGGEHGKGHEVLLHGWIVSKRVGHLNEEGEAAAAFYASLNCFFMAQFPIARRC